VLGRRANVHSKDRGEHIVSDLLLPFRSSTPIAKLDTGAQIVLASPELLRFLEQLIKAINDLQQRVKALESP
jgi:hypothetical protein